MTDSVLLITGATGYIASHCVAWAFHKGYGTVRGTVRSKDSDKSKELQALFPKLELVECPDLCKDDGWSDAFKGVTHLLHMASPYSLEKDVSKYVPFAVEGTNRALKFAHEAGTVKKVVVTSSMASIICGHDLTNKTFTAKDWSTKEAAEKEPYCLSKLLAEQAVWEFHKTQKPSFTISCVCPAMVQGPTLLSHHGGAQSSQFIIGLLAGAMETIPNGKAPVVDVRDVAEIHLSLLDPSNSWADGQRFLTVDKCCWMIEDVGKFFEFFGKWGYSKWPKTPAPVPQFLIENDVGKDYHMDAGDAVKLLSAGKFIPAETSYHDHAKTLIANGTLEGAGLKPSEAPPADWMDWRKHDVYAKITWPQKE